MPDVISKLQVLADLPLYKTEKPYCVLLTSTREDIDAVQTSNLHFTHQDGVVFHDLRDREDEFTLDKNGFEIVSYGSQYRELDNLEKLKTYELETEEFLMKRFGAIGVFCYEVKLRKNCAFERKVFDLNDRLAVDTRAVGAHNDVTRSSGPRMISTRMPEHAKSQFLKPGYRYRIVNTWRSLVNGLEDNPLAFCDFRTVDKNDLVAADRIIPTRVGEVYYLKPNPKQNWYWLDKMTPEEPVAMMMYDTAKGIQAKYCPHVSFENPNAPEDAEVRRSVETRSIVVSRD